MKRAVIAAVAALYFLMAIPAFAQSATTPAAPVTTTWSASMSAVALPGGSNSIAGTDANVGFAPSPNWVYFQRDLLSTDGSLKYFAGGATRWLPALSVAANNASPNVNFMRVRFGLTGSIGEAQVNGVNGYGETAGGIMQYQLTAGGAWAFGAKAEYAHFPNYPGHVILEVSTKFQF